MDDWVWAEIWPTGHDLLTPDLGDQQYLYIDLDFLLGKKSLIAVFSNCALLSPGISVELHESMGGDGRMRSRERGHYLEAVGVFINLALRHQLCLVYARIYSRVYVWW